MKLKCIQPKTTREDARVLFQRRLRRFTLGRFLCETEFYLPYYLFRVEVQNAGKTFAQFLAIDAARGELDLYRFESIPAAVDLIEVETIQFSPAAVSAKAAFALLQEKVRREVYRQGFFQVSDLRITGTLLQHYYCPYWIGLYEQKNQVKVEVVDAVRGCLEGAKVRELALTWFQAEAAK
jgi:hypothetical protein